MTMSKILVSVLMTAGIASAQASSFDCIAPELPERSMSNESVRRAQKQIRQWRNCYASFNAGGRFEGDAARLNVEVDINIQRWLDNTRAHSRGYADILSSIERDRRTFLRDSPRTYQILR
jgi:hypothetical protein